MLLSLSSTVSILVTWSALCDDPPGICTLEHHHYCKIFTKPDVHQRNSEQGSANSLRVSVGESTFEYRSIFASDMPCNFKPLPKIRRETWSSLRYSSLSCSQLKRFWYGSLVYLDPGASHGRAHRHHRRQLIDPWKVDLLDVSFLSNRTSHTGRVK